MWCIRLLGQMKTKSQVACKRRQIDAIADETSLPYTDGEAVSNPVGDIPITGIIVAISHRVYMREIGTIAAAIIILKYEQDDIFNCFDIL